MSGGKRVLGGADEAAIAALEAELGVSLPADYRSFLAQDGAGIVDGVEVFGLGGQVGPPNLRWLLGTMPRRGFVRPRALVPFAELGNGDLIALVCEPFEGHPAGAVVYWAPRPGGASELAPAAACFSNFLRGERVS